MKYRATRKTTKQKAMDEELNQGMNDDDIIFDIQMKATYTMKGEDELG
jgi:hypothetical protein